MSASLAIGLSACSSSDDPTVNGPDPGDNVGSIFTISSNAGEYPLIDQSLSIESSSNDNLKWTVTRANGELVIPQTTNPLQFAPSLTGVITIQATIGEGEQLQQQSLSVTVWQPLNKQLSALENFPSAYYVTQDGFATASGGRINFDGGSTLHIRHNEQSQLTLTNNALILAGEDQQQLILNGSIALDSNAILRASYSQIEGNIQAQRGGIEISNSRLSGNVDLSASLTQQGFINDNGSIKLQSNDFLKDQTVSIGYINSQIQGNVFCGDSNNLNLQKTGEHQISDNQFFGTVTDVSGDLSLEQLPNNQWKTDASKETRCQI